MFINFNKIKLIPFFCLWGFFIFGNFISAANENDIIINEIAAFKSSGYEWIEIYNTTNSEIDLTNWKFIESFSESDKDGISHGLNPFPSHKDLIIQPNKYAIIAQNAEKFLEKYEISSDVTIIDSSWGSLNEKGEKIALKDSDENILESFTYFPCPENSLERINPELKNYSADNWQETAIETPGKENSVYLISEINENNNEDENLKNENDKEENRAPIADAGGDMEIFVNQEIEFDASDSSDPDNDEISFSWNFGDGKNGQGINPVYSYKAAGEFKVILTVSDGDLSSTDSLIVKVIKTSYSQDIIINEILPNPKGSDTSAAPQGEWIELYNQSGQKINLAGWKLDDLISSGSKPYAIDSEIFIEPNGYLIFYYGQTKICLNNNGDEVNLINPQGKIISTCSYQEKSAEQTSLARGKDGQWYWSVEPTPNKENLITLAESFSEEEDEEENGDESSDESLEKESGDLENSKENPKEASISEVKNLAKGTWVRTRGTVSAPPKILSDKVFYISSEESGIQIYSSKGDFSEINSGDFVEIIGKTSEANNEKKINIYSADDVEILDADFPPEPKIIKTGEIDETLEGSLVKIEGQVSRSAGNVFYVNDGSGEIKIYIRSITGIKKPKTSKGTWVAIAGIVSETSTGYRILPRFQEDVLIGRVAGSNILPQAGADLFFILILSLIGLLAVFLTRRHPMPHGF